jgi:cardiolipin synthase
MMEQAGVEFRKYRPLRWYNLGRVNNRTHRKLLVVDGRIGFTGGVGIADVWTGHAQDSTHWRDSHYRIEGPAVAQMQAAFTDNWITATGEVLHGLWSRRVRSRRRSSAVRPPAGARAWS